MPKPWLWQFEEASRVAVVRLAYVKLTGDMVAGMLLSQIVYWFRPDSHGNSKLSIFRDGKYWLAKRRHEWQAEIGISPKQFDRACDLLESMGVIERKVFRFGRGTANHLTLNVPVLSSLLRGMLSAQKVNSYRTSRKGNSYRSCQKGESIYTEITSKKITAETTGASAMTLSHEVLEKLAGKKNKGFPPHLVVTKVSDLQRWWERMVPYYHDVGFLKPLTQKERGQLSLFLKTVGSESAYAVMHWAVKNWGQFWLDVKDEKGESTSKVPSVGALLKHCDVAVRGFKGKDVQSIATSEPKMLSKEEQEAKIAGEYGSSG